MRLLIALGFVFALATPAVAGSGNGECPYSKPAAVEAAAPPEAPPVARQEAKPGTDQALEVAENAPKPAPPAGSGGR